ncbi:type 1 glutamine amidotransferase [Pseudoponticoccus marisrubri]|uniref:Glutamine amidotransferase n=1 Tax=Pseudoponticoccus marisrubri TaxID=1685382 RepID=A0A0W7WKV1_9RHOB|nr:type 1 glutamine amidotransferase [Pseudoponticoccus marisrubri]KUF11211.1 glutamine amidotransferase [Pseudoponticoccus marisrubri]
MKIGILETGLLVPELAERHGTYPQMFERLLAGRGFDFETWSVVQEQFPNGPEAAEGWLITGSRHGVYEDHPWLPPLEQLIRDITAAGRPLVGVCFGHQVIAQALGGRVEKFAGGWSVGPQDYDFPGGRRRLQAWHQDQVITPPEGAQTVARSDFCAHAALLYPGRAYSVQPHPEFDDATVGGLIEKRGPGVVPDDQLDAARAGLGQPLDSALLADQFERFFRERRIS